MHRNNNLKLSPGTHRTIIGSEDQWNTKKVSVVNELENLATLKVLRINLTLGILRLAVYL